MTSERIGFVGVGLMGHGMAKNLLNAGYPLAVISHKNRAPVEDLVERGATEVQTLTELASESSIIHICAPGSPQVEAIVQGLLQSLIKGTIVVDCSTSDPTSTVALARSVESVGGYMADAPLGGTPVQAEAGELSAMVGAESAVFERLKPVLSAWAKSFVHLGPSGAGHKMKLLNNFLSLGYAALYSEALALSNKVGLTTGQFDSVIRGSRMDCGFYQTFMGYALEGNREAHKFTLTNAFKDMRYLEAMADEVGLANPIGNAVKNSFALALAAGGDGPEDYVPHLVDFVARQNNVTLE
ncbi:NAD(P)-dependent oxidoreductase [Marivita geojedonensis]|uniref:3-hydroxyisobutyrate dehydrogenase n=1 Tax=Marivita geojedonensis TaxID=1123756 RepID=A0A1X4NAD2_9RHOB|nr:NAD(P)-dependent oxidoreductase [Marivita geojedonensis]OSQ43381.1 3-hydroxyisobutyrate dehydrogenase [Marivita geojedonensis]PRY72165.1 3-hydroxyisobutyrate dehydrogenase-like beta-hydroxyacid dehydrogenase [Marivita geojedonensis]